jgi:alpha-tubulin suppressor-like RCC1 family protein
MPYMYVRQAHRIALAAVALSAAGCGDRSDAPTAPVAAPATGGAASVAATPTVWQQLASGQEHTCGLTASGQAFCWGGNRENQLGDGTGEDRVRPTAVAGGLVFRQLSAGALHTCGITTDDRLFCWGWNATGQLGDGTMTNRLVPVAVAGNRRYRSVTTGDFHTCALARADSRAFCWGWGLHGSLGTGSTDQQPTPSPVNGNRAFRQIDAGGEHTCAVTPSDQAFCWGRDLYGALGDDVTRKDQPFPTLVAGGYAFSQISAGDFNTCAVTTGQLAYCWGDGPVGDAGFAARFTPRLVGAGRVHFRRVSAGRTICGESTTGQAYCWGDAAEGSLGDVELGTSYDLGATQPVRVTGGHTFTQLSTASIHTCGKDPAGAAWCWGLNRDGELGDGTTESRAEPTRVLEPE